MQHYKSNCAVFYGTSAELIKLWPVIRALSSETETRLFTTNQQPVELRHLELQLGLTEVTHLRNERGGNLVTRLQVVPWFFIALFTSIQTLRRFKRESRGVKKKVLVIIHGDTMTCVVGGLAGRLVGCKVAHIEAGLRSGDIRNPFP
jgi:UDP-N-acetylglucosamine 2-epimerase (non-hydrolysing)